MKGEAIYPSASARGNGECCVNWLPELHLLVCQFFGLRITRITREVS